MRNKRIEFNTVSRGKRFLQSMGRHKMRTGIIIFLLLIISVIIIPIAISYDSSPVGHFRSYEGEQAYKQAYDEAMKLLPTPSRTIDIETDYGVVRVYEFHNDQSISDIPIVLLPGRSSGVPMWSQNLIDLVSERSVYAIDALGDAGLSVQTKKLENSTDQARWLEQVFDYLELTKVHLVGHSFGGWSAANYVVHYSERVITLSLVEPVFVFTGIRWQLYLKSLPASIPILPQSWRDKMLADIGGASEIDLNDPIARMISEATKHYAAVLPVPEQLTKEQLSGLKLPVYAALAEKSSIHDVQDAYETAVREIENLQIKIWPDATHSLPMEFTEQLDREILDFMSMNE
jgi:pimeloyl-ACP methyl ester carboxylesterase